MSHATTPFPSDLAGVIRALCDVLTHEASAALDGDAEGVHHARVAARRLREALALVVGAPKTDADRLRNDARRLRGGLGPLREADVLLALLAQEAVERRWAASTTALVERRLKANHDAARHHALHALGRLDLTDFVARSAVVMASLDRDPHLRGSARRLTHRTRVRARGLLEALRHVGPFYAPMRFHEARIAAKKLRYVLELVRDLGRVAVDAELETLRAGQDTLGRLHDLQALQAAVDAVAAEAGGARPRRALAAMSAAVAAECRSIHGSFLLTVPMLAEVAHRAQVLGVATKVMRAATTSRAAARRMPRSRRALRTSRRA